MIESMLSLLAAGLIIIYALTWFIDVCNSAAIKALSNHCNSMHDVLMDHVKMIAHLKDQIDKLQENQCAKEHTEPHKDES